MEGERRGGTGRNRDIAEEVVRERERERGRWGKKRDKGVCG